MKVYAVSQLVPAGRHHGQPLSFQELVNVWEKGRKALEYVRSNPDHTNGYYIHVFDAGNGELLGLAEYKLVDGRMTRLKGPAIVF